MMPKTYLLAACAAAALSCPANALTLISAAVFGSANNTVWATAGAPNTVASNYTLFLQNPTLGAFLNPNDEAIHFNAPEGTNYAFLSGDGFPINSTLNSDPSYTLVLTFDNGATITGSYLPGTPNSFTAGAASTIDGLRITMTEFSFTRSLADVVGPYSAVPRTGDGNDYAGNFEFTVERLAVPEPAQWLMLVSGFGLLGGALRQRRKGADAHTITA
jgi:hypothetical protein